MVKSINTTADVTLEELYKLKEENVDFIEVNEKNYSRYSIDKFIEIKKAINDFIKNLPKVDVNDSDAQKKIFSFIYTKMAYLIKYDEVACRACDYTGYERDMSQDVVERASNLEGALLNGNALCLGYSVTLKSLLAELGIESKVVYGGNRKNRHAWNQVKLDGKWYHCDITNDAAFILEGLVAPHFLKSTKDCTRVTMYPTDVDALEESLESVDDEKQYDFIFDARKTVLEEMEAKRIEDENFARQKAEEEKRSKRPKFVNKILDMLENLKGNEKGAE